MVFESTWAGGAALFPQFFPSPHFDCSFDGEREAELVSEKADLSAMVGFVGDHVGDHGHSDGPAARPAVPVKLFYTARVADQRFGEKVLAQGGAG